MGKSKVEMLEAVEHGDDIIVVALTRDHVRPETLPDTRHFLINALSIDGGHRTLVVDVSALDHKDMLFGLKYRDGLTLRSDANSQHIHNISTGDNLTIIKELLYIHKILGFLGKNIIVAGADKEARQIMKKTKIDRQLTCKDTVEDALGTQAMMPDGDDRQSASDATH